MMVCLHISVPLGQVSQNSLSVAVDNGTASNSSNKFQVNYQKFTEPLLFFSHLDYLVPCLMFLFSRHLDKEAESLRTLLSQRLNCKHYFA